MSIDIKDIDHGYKQIVEEIHKFERGFLKVGILSDAPEYETDKGTVNAADVATFNEYGTSTSPSRPFMRQTFDKWSDEIQKILGEGMNRIIEKKQQAKMVLKELGVWYKGKIQDQITHGDFAPNAPSTMVMKAKKKGGKTTPLIDTGRMRQSINYTIEDL